MQWFRMYAEFIHDPKMLTISRDARLLFVELCCLATAQEDANGCTRHTQEQAMIALRLHHKTFKASLKELQDIGVCGVNTDGMVFLANWEKRQKTSDTSKERTKKYRENLKHVTSQKRHSDALEKSRIDKNRIDKKNSLSSERELEKTTDPLESPPPPEEPPPEPPAMPPDNGHAPPEVSEPPPIPPDFLAFAVEDRGWHEDTAVQVFRTFRDYWGELLPHRRDSFAAWRKWCLNERNPPPPRSRDGPNVLETLDEYRSRKAAYRLEREERYALEAKLKQEKLERRHDHA